MKLRTVARAAAALTGPAVAAAETLLRGGASADGDNDRGDPLRRQDADAAAVETNGRERRLRDDGGPYRVFPSGIDPEIRNTEVDFGDSYGYVPPEDHDRIIGGQAAGEGDCPSCVSLSDQWGHFCGGSLIAKNVVLTASHCLGGTSFDVIAGRTDLDSVSSGKAIGVKEEVGHPDYDADTTNMDFALLLLEDSFDLGGNVGLVEVNSSPSVPGVGNQVTVMGWGDTNKDSYETDLSNKLMKVNVNVITNIECGRSQGTTSDGFDETYEGQITDEMLCARVPGGGKDACQGDSGGPLFVETTSGTRQVGVVSWGTGCAERDFPGVYARVSRVYPWIRDFVCENGDDPPSSFNCGGSINIESANSPTDSGSSNNGGSTNGSISLPALNPDNGNSAPSPAAPSPTPPSGGGGNWKSVLVEGFDNGIGSKFTGGEDTKFFEEAKYRFGIMRLQLGLPGQAERASIVTKSMDVSGYDACRVVVSYMFVGMESTDGFCVESSTDMGSWSGVKCIYGDERTDKRWYDGETAEFDVSGASTAQVRLRIKANNRKDDVLVDEVAVECQ